MECEGYEGWSNDCWVGGWVFEGLFGLYFDVCCLVWWFENDWWYYYC